MYYIFQVERTEESLMRARCAHQSIDRSDHHQCINASTFRTHVSILCHKQHSIRPSYVNSLEKPSLKRLQNHQDIGCSTYSTVVLCRVGEAETPGRAGGPRTSTAQSNLRVEPEVCCSSAFHNMCSPESKSLSAEPQALGISYHCLFFYVDAGP